jgi:hypothetical protein
MRFVNAQQARMINNYKNTKENLFDTNASVVFGSTKYVKLMGSLHTINMPK